ncbi:MAG: transglycosylase domain-containing protein, partial [Firmicutes bacterium]|nr:transglycosylase domain-containing protein [Bacillota bacterium]
AMIAIEDERFYEHFGIDIRSIARAAYSTFKGTRLEGGSTITQQLIKNNVTKVQRNTYETKIQEQYLAVKYESLLEEQLGSKEAAKKYILELYLNTIGLGNGYNGVQAAALGYFNKSTPDLTLAESAVIAAITNNPTYYDPRTNPENNKDRQEQILKKMKELGFITQSEYDEAIAQDVYTNVYHGVQYQDEEANVIHSYYVDALFEQISKDLQSEYNMSVTEANNILYNGGLNITAAIDPSIQQIVDEAYLNDALFPDVYYSIDVTYTVSVEDSATGEQQHSEYKQFVRNKEAADEFVENTKQDIAASLTPTQSIIADRVNYNVQPQSSMVIMDYHTGEVRALAGGRGQKLVNRGFNRSVNSERQPGSVFKVLASFAPGIDIGTLTPATVIDDVPFTSPDGYSPKNWYHSYRGLSTIREGVRDSMNIVAVKSMIKTGVPECYDYLLNLGFTTLDNDCHAATALGGLTTGVTQIEVTAAYAAIANNGEYLRPMLYKKVLDHDGNILLENKMDAKPVFKPTTSFLVTNMMQDVVKSGTGTAVKFDNSAMPISGKTGTSEDSRDLTFVGFTPYYAAGVWLGYDRYDDTVPNMSDLDQASHLRFWKYVMEKVHEGYEVKDFPQPEGIVTATICTESGKLAGSLCSSDPRGNCVRTEYFAQGSEPTDYCNVHQAMQVCSESYMTPTQYCPNVITKAGIVRPEPYTGSEYVEDKKYEVYSTSYCNIHTTAQAPAEEEKTEGETTEGGEASGSSETGEEELPPSESAVPSSDTSQQTDPPTPDNSSPVQEEAPPDPILGSEVEPTPSDTPIMPDNASADDFSY